MRRVLILLCVLFAFSPAMADIEVGDIVVLRRENNVNVRVNMHNPGPGAAYSPIAVRLFVREHDGEEWRLVKEWTNVTKLPVGYRVSRDYFNEAPGDWDPAFHAPSFQVRATAVSSAGRVAEFEKAFP